MFMLLEIFLYTVAHTVEWLFIWVELLLLNENDGNIHSLHKIWTTYKIVEQQRFADWLLKLQYHKI